jgi:hypothetical protein
MDSTPDAPRLLLPVIDIRNRITHWRCSRCRWSHLLAANFTGMRPSPSVLKDFTEHHCDEHAEH